MITNVMQNIKVLDKSFPFVGSNDSQLVGMNGSVNQIIAQQCGK